MFFLLLLLSIGFSCTVRAQAQEKDVNSVAVVDTSSLTFTEVYRDVRSGGGTLYSDIKSVIKDLSESLKVGAEHVYSVLIRQQYVKAGIGLGVLILLIVCITYFMRLMLGKYGDLTGDYDINEKGIIAIVLGILTVVILISFFAGGFYSEIIQGFVNPEYGAIRGILDLVNNVK